MSDRPKTDNSVDFVEETHNIFNIYSTNRDTWSRNAKEDKEFRLGRQWTKEQEEVLKSRGQAPIVINRIHPAVEAAKAMLTANRPLLDRWLMTTIQWVLVMLMFIRTL